MAQTAQDDLRITDQFDLEALWARHGKKIGVGVLVVLALGGIVLLRQNQANQRIERAATRLAAAYDPASLEQVANEFAGTQTALEALSRLGDIQYHQGEYASATGTYEKILREFPSNPLSESARLGLAAVQEAQGSYDTAIGMYSRIIESGPTSFVAFSSRMGMARCLDMLGKVKEARQIYEEVIAGAQGSPWHQEAYLRWLVLGRELPAAPPAVAKDAESPSQPSFPLVNPSSGKKQP